MSPSAAVKPGEAFEALKQIARGEVLQLAIGDVRLEWRAMAPTDLLVRCTQQTDAKRGHHALELEVVLRPEGDAAHGQAMLLQWKRPLADPPPMLRGETRMHVVRDERGLIKYVSKFQ